LIANPRQASIGKGFKGFMGVHDLNLILHTEMSKVKALRDEGEKLHKEGKHTESMKALAEAKKLLGG
jgi:hypothetical protein